MSARYVLPVNCGLFGECVVQKSSNYGIRSHELGRMASIFEAG